MASPKNPGRLILRDCRSDPARLWYYYLKGVTALGPVRRFFHEPALPADGGGFEERMLFDPIHAAMVSDRGRWSLDATSFVILSQA